MTMSGIERRLVDVLNQRAEDAMEHTDTHEKLDLLLGDAHQEKGRRRRTLTAVAVGAAAAAIAVIAWVSSDTERRGTAPAVSNSPEAVALAFLDAFGSFDQAEAASLLAQDAETAIYNRTTDPGPDPWREYNTWLQAIGFQLLDRSCVEDSTTASGSVVLCVFGLHAFRSDEMGKGPYENNLFKFTIHNGEVVMAEWEPSASNGVRVELAEPFAAWVAQTHPDDASDMYAAWPDQSGAVALTPRSIDLWEQHLKEYAASQK